MNEVTIRTAETYDLPGILETLKAALGETPLLRRTPELWAWKHTKNPFGPSIVLVAAAGSRIAGVRAMMRWRLRTTSGETLECLRPVDTATHPDFARRGIFRELTMTALEIAGDQGVHLVFNTPNPKSAPGYLKMGWRHVAWLGAMVRPRLGRAVTPVPGEVPFLPRVAPAVASIEEMPTALPERDPRGMRTPRPPDYLAWRFRAHPTARYGWVADSEDGGLVTRASARNGRTELVVSDLLGIARPRVIGSAARGAQVRYLAGWFSPKTPERSIAIKGGMIPVPGLRSLRLVALPLADLDFDVHDLSSWDLATSDLELL